MLRVALVCMFSDGSRFVPCSPSDKSWSDAVLCSGHRFVMSVVPEKYTMNPCLLFSFRWSIFVSLIFIFSLENSFIYVYIWTLQHWCIPQTILPVVVTLQLYYYLEGLISSGDAHPMNDIIIRNNIHFILQQIQQLRLKFSRCFILWFRQSINNESFFLE